MKRSLGGRISDLIYAISGVSIGPDHMPATPEVEKAVASILTLTAMSDGIVSTEETERLVVILRKGFAMDAIAALALVTDAMHDLPVRPGLYDLMTELNGVLGIRDKEDLVVMLLEVIAADGHKEAEEMEVLAHTVYGLRISQKSMQRAYKRYFSSRRGRSDQLRG